MGEQADYDRLGKFLVSGWDDDMSDIDKTRNPPGTLCVQFFLFHYKLNLNLEKLQRQILNAAEKGHLDQIKDLLEQDPNLIKASDKDMYTPLHRACYGDHLEVVKYLIQKGANIAAETDLKWQPLHSCVQWNHVECAAYLIQCGADVNAPSEGG